MARSSFYNTNPSATDLVLGADLLLQVTAAKDAAAASATLAGTYATTAQSSLNLIYASVNTAIDAAHLASDNAAASAALASLKADEAAGSASDAAADVALIAGYASTATTKASEAATSATNSENSKIASTAAALAANADAVAAALSADDAYDSEQAALASKNAAASSASAASTDAGLALTRANAAAGSATAASTSASDALTRANNALASANNSANSATDALTYRGQALTYRNEAEGFKNAAASSAAAAATFDPALFMPKAGGTFTGNIIVENATPSLTLKDATDGTTRSVLNDSGVIGFVGSAGTYVLHASDAGAIWTPSMGDVGTHIENRAAAHAANKLIKTGDTMSGPITHSYAYPQINFYWAGVKHTRWIMDAGGNILLQDGGGQNHFYVSPGGAVWTQQFGDLNNRIEDRAYAWAEAKKNEAISHANWLHNNQQGDVNERVHRIQFAGYGESANPGWSVEAPVVVNDVFFNGYQCHRRFKTLQMYIPGQGGWVNVWSS